MKACHAILLFLSFSILCSPPANAQDRAENTVTKNASPEARALLKFFYSISGEYMLTGQHNYPNVQGRNSRFAAEYIGKTPIIYGTDWGFANDNNTDSYHARQDIVNEAIRQNKLGSVITICWHAVPPTANEPVTFQPLPGANPAMLASVQGKLLDQQFKDLLTPGTEMYKHWCAQVDTIAYYLKELQDAHVPILWRPYHEMNGDWFWWGGRVGEYSTIRLYRQLFDRLVNHHKLNNLVWLWSLDRPSLPGRKFSYFYPGNDLFDIACLDVYGSDFNQAYYDSLLVLAKGKPIALAEVGNPPMPEILKRQPKWTYYMVWAGMVRNTTKKQYEELVDDSHVLCLEDTAYWNAIAPYRSVAGFPSLAEMKRPTDFSGEWVFDEGRSRLDNGGTGNLPGNLGIVQKDGRIIIKRTMISEYEDNSISSDTLTTDGREKDFISPFRKAPGKISARLSDKGDTLYIDSKVSFTNGGQSRELISNEAWVLQEHGKSLSIVQSSVGFRGKRSVTAVYLKR